MPAVDELVYGNLGNPPYAGFRNSWCGFTTGHFMELHVSDNCVEQPATTQVFEGVTGSSCTVQECAISAPGGCYIPECDSGCWDNSYCTKIAPGLQPSRASTTTIIDLSNSDTAESDAYTIVNPLFPTGLDC